MISKKKLKLNKSGVNKKYQRILSLYQELEKEVQGLGDLIEDAKKLNQRVSRAVDKKEEEKILQNINQIK